MVVYFSSVSLNSIIGTEPETTIMLAGWF